MNKHWRNGERIEPTFVCHALTKSDIFNLVRLHPKLQTARVTPPVYLCNPCGCLPAQPLTPSGCFARVMGWSGGVISQPCFRFTDWMLGLVPRTLRGLSGNKLYLSGHWTAGCFNAEWEDLISKLFFVDLEISWSWQSSLGMKTASLWGGSCSLFIALSTFSSRS